MADGIVRFYSPSWSAIDGGLPTRLNREFASEYYIEKTIGITRNYLAKQNNEQIELLLEIPRRYDVSIDTIAKVEPFSHTDGSTYRVVQIQQSQTSDGLPASVVSLERLEGSDE